MQQHAMVEVGIDPALTTRLIGKIDDHAERVELVRFERDDRAAVVAMEMAALALVIQQAMTSSESASDLKHAWLSSTGVIVLSVESLKQQRPGTLPPKESCMPIQATDLKDCGVRSAEALLEAPFTQLADRRACGVSLVQPQPRGAWSRSPPLLRTQLAVSAFSAAAAICSSMMKV